MIRRICKIAPGGFCTRKEAQVSSSELPCGSGESDAAKLEICPTAQLYFLGLITKNEIVPKGGDTIEMASEGYSSTSLTVAGTKMRTIESGALAIL